MITFGLAPSLLQTDMTSDCGAAHTETAKERLPGSNQQEKCYG